MKRVLLFLSLFLVAPVYAQTVVVGSGVESLAGDTTPQLGGDLDVNGNDITSAAGLDIAIGASAGNDFTVDTSKLVVEGDTGNIGIGTATPLDTLHLESVSYPGILAKATSATGIPSFKLENGTRQWQIEVGRSDSSRSFGISDITAGSFNRFVIDSAGNVGIGESTPTAELHITWASTPSLFIESTTATDGGQFILEDTDGAGCTGITALNGVLTATTIACP